MHVDPYLELSRTCDRLARRRRSWLADPRLDGRPIGGLVKTVRAFRLDVENSDRMIRALTEIGGQETDAMTVLIHALAGPLRSKLRRSVTEEYRASALGDLTLVIFDSVANGEPPRQDHLARRYLARAHNRSSRAERRAHTHGTKTIATVEPLGPDRLIGLQDQRLRGGDDVAAQAVDRAALGAFAYAVAQAIDEKVLTEQAWASFRDHRLGRVFTKPTRPATVHERAAAHRASQRVRLLAACALGADAASPCPGQGPVAGL